MKHFTLALKILICCIVVSIISSNPTEIEKDSLKFLTENQPKISVQSRKLESITGKHLTHKAKFHDNQSQQDLDNACFKVFPENGKDFKVSYNQWSGIQVEFKIINTCQWPKPIDELHISFSGFSINGYMGYTPEATFESNPFLDFSSMEYDGLGNACFDISTHYETWAFIKPQQTIYIKYSAWPRVDVVSFAITDVKMGVELPEIGELKITVDSSSIEKICRNSRTGCNLTFNLINRFQVKVKTINVDPQRDPHATIFLKHVQDDDYTIQVEPSSLPQLTPEEGEIRVTYDPPIIDVKDRALAYAHITVTLIPGRVAPSTDVGLVITLSPINDFKFDSIGEIRGTLTNSSNRTDERFFITPGGRFFFPNLAPGTYTVSIQGVGDPDTGAYYSAQEATVRIEGLRGASVNLQYTPHSDNNMFALPFQVDDEPQNQVINFMSPNFKYLPTTLNSGVFYFVEPTSYAIQAPGYKVITNPNPLSITPSVQHATIAFRPANAALLAEKKNKKYAQK